MPNITGQCLCGNITYSADTDIKLMANCHCTDCRTVTGAAYATMLFIEESALQVNGTPSVFHHVADSGAQMEKHFCSACGSQLFTKNSNRVGLIGLRAGGIDQPELVKPGVNVYLSSKIESTPIDPAVNGFEKMPG